jgi:hypothetical protein
MTGTTGVNFRIILSTVFGRMLTTFLRVSSLEQAVRSKEWELMPSTGPRCSWVILIRK